MQLVRIGLEHPDLRYEIFYGVSANERVLVGQQHAPTPTATAPPAAPRTTATPHWPAQARMAPDPIGDFFQGGPFCSDEADADRDDIW